MNGPGAFIALGGHVVYEGRLIDVAIERFRHPDGEEVSREIVRHRGAVGIVAYDSEHVWLVRQPREAVGEPALLEIPAGRLDVEGEQPIDTARRELAEEVSLGAENFTHILTYYSSAGFTDERVHLFSATGLYERRASAEENERIVPVRWPLVRLTHALDQCADAKTIIALLWLQSKLRQ